MIQWGLTPDAPRFYVAQVENWGVNHRHWARPGHTFQFNKQVNYYLIVQMHLESKNSAAII